MSRKSTTPRINGDVCGFPSSSPGVGQDAALGSHGTEENHCCVTDRAEGKLVVDVQQELCILNHFWVVAQGADVEKWKPFAVPKSHSSEEQSIPVIPWFWIRPGGLHRRVLLVPVLSWVWGVCWKGAAWEVCVNRNAQLAQSLLSACALRDWWRKWCLGADWHTKPVGHTWQSLCVLLAACLGC